VKSTNPKFEANRPSGSSAMTIAVEGPKWGVGYFGTGRASRSARSSWRRRRCSTSLLPAEGSALHTAIDPSKPRRALSTFAFAVSTKCADLCQRSVLRVGVHCVALVFWDCTLPVPVVEADTLGLSVRDKRKSCSPRQDQADGHADASPIDVLRRARASPPQCS
jgi:hypothetical protein